MYEQILLIVLLDKGKCNIEELFRFFTDEFADQNPWLGRNEFDHDLEGLLRSGNVKREDNTIEITDEGIKFLRSDKIVRFLEKVLSGTKLWDKLVK